MKTGKERQRGTRFVAEPAEIGGGGGGKEEGWEAPISSRAVPE